jgi:hypothetical protein
MSNNFDLRKFLTENKLTSVAKTIKEAEEPQAGGNAASDKLNLTGVNSEINNAKSFAKAIIGLANKLSEKEGFNPESNPHIRKAMEFLNAAAGNAAQEGVNEAPNMPPVPGQAQPSGSPTAMAPENFAKFKEALKLLAQIAGKQGGIPDGLAKPLMKIMQTINLDNVNYTHNANEETALTESEGYVEVMGEEFDQAVEEIALAWEKWKNGPATEPEDIEPAKVDILDYIKSMLR